MGAQCMLSVAALAVLVAMPLAARAQSVSEAIVDSVLRSPASAASAPVTASGGAAQPVWSRRRLIDMTSLRVIELPEEPLHLGARGRKHHALSWRNDSLSHALDNVGLNNADCHNRVRLPSRLRRAPGDGPAVQVQLQVAVGCSF
jgi:hypothetical protein